MGLAGMGSEIDSEGRVTAQFCGISLVIPAEKVALSARPRAAAAKTGAERGRSIDASLKTYKRFRRKKSQRLSEFYRFSKAGYHRPGGSGCVHFLRGRSPAEVRPAASPTRTFPDCHPPSAELGSVGKWRSGQRSRSSAPICILARLLCSLRTVNRVWQAHHGPGQGWIVTKRPSWRNASRLQIPESLAQIPSGQECLLADRATRGRSAFLLIAPEPMPAPGPNRFSASPPVLAQRYSMIGWDPDRWLFRSQPALCHTGRVVRTKLLAPDRAPKHWVLV